VCFNVLQYVAMCCNLLQWVTCAAVDSSKQCNVAHMLCCSVSQCVAVCRSVLQRGLQCVAACGRGLQCVAVCCGESPVRQLADENTAMLCE